MIKLKFMMILIKIQNDDYHAVIMLIDADD